MNCTNNKWIYALLIILILLVSLNLWLSNQSRSEKEFTLQRDSIIQLKIDSISTAVNDFRELYGNDRLISNNEQIITNNYITYNRKKNELLKNPIDSIYNWTKHKLSMRTE